MWSGDIAANMPSLEAQMNVQMHMALSGIDYFGSDVGGFNRQVFDPVLGQDGMYTVWLANSALLDVPLRPHAANLQNIYPTAPSLVGDVPTNLANVRLRYALSPYLYTLAQRAYRDGEAVIAPLVYGYQADPDTANPGQPQADRPGPADGLAHRLRAGDHPGLPARRGLVQLPHGRVRGERRGMDRRAGHGGRGAARAALRA